MSVSLLLHVCLSSLSHDSRLFFSLLLHIFLCLFLSSYDLSLSLSFHLSPNDDDNDHSSTQLLGRKHLPWGPECVGLGSSLVGELLASCRNKLSKCTCWGEVRCGVVWCRVVLCRVVCGVWITLSMTMTMSTPAVGSLCTHGPDLPWVHVP